MERSIDFSLPVRRAVVAHLKTKTVLTSLVSAASIHGERPKSMPEKPFILLGFQVATGWEATMLSGSRNTFSIDAFSRGPYTDQIYAINAAIVEAMLDFVLPTLDLRDLQWTGSITLPDGQDDYHGVVGYSLIATQTE